MKGHREPVWPLLVIFATVPMALLMSWLTRVLPESWVVAILAALGGLGLVLRVALTGQSKSRRSLDARLRDNVRRHLKK